ncbi:MAG: hypothetical protein ACRED2_09085 [Methylocella sp.]
MKTLKKRRPVRRGGRRVYPFHLWACDGRRKGGDALTVELDILNAKLAMKPPSELYCAVGNIWARHGVISMGRTDCWDAAEQYWATNRPPRATFCAIARAN